MKLYDAMERQGDRFAQLDKQAIDISGRSGALDVGFMSLSKYYESRASARNKLVAGCVYPAVLLLVAVFGAKFPAFFLGASGGNDTARLITSGTRSVFSRWWRWFSAA
jgi:hypothetical protein